MNLSLTRQVLYNCDVSDARHAGIYSICGLALRLRDLFKWEHRLPPWQEGPPDEVLAWIGRKEDVWETLIEGDYRPLTIEGRSYDPFDTRAVNAAVNGQGLYYGAGYAHSLKPTFFLARINGRQSIDGRTIWHLGRELARDLLTLPAFTQDDEIVLRADSAATHLWDQIAYIGNSGRTALAFALRACCGITDTLPKTVREHLDRILAVQQMVHLRHELSELEEKVFDRATWRRMISDYPHTPVELLARALKDMLADSGPEGTLSFLIGQRDSAALGLYMAFGLGLSRELFADLRTAFAEFMLDADWDGLRRGVNQTYRQAVEYSREIMTTYTQGQERDDPASIQSAIEESMRQRGLIGRLENDQE